MKPKRVALITGGARGIGTAIVEKLADCGFSIVINYRRSERQAYELMEKLQRRNINVMAVRADVSRYDEVEAMHARIKGYMGVVDTLINNAGTSLIKPLCDCTERDFDDVIANNLKSVFNTCQIFSKDMVSRRFGRIVNISSVWGEVGASAETIYSGAKAGVIGFTKALNAELAPNGVLVNVVSPGFIETDMTNNLSEKEMKEFLSIVPLNRIGKPNEVADVVELLTREETYISGANISVNGGIV